MGSTTKSSVVQHAAPTIIDPTIHVRTGCSMSMGFREAVVREGAVDRTRQQPDSHRCTRR